MIKVFYGKKGTGKTKLITDMANNLVEKCKGQIVFIDDSSHLMYDIRHDVRFINISEYPVKGSDSFSGFICGLAAGNYDIECILIDGLTYIIKQNGCEEAKDCQMEGFFDKISDLSDNRNIDFYITVTGDEEAIPSYIARYI